MSFSTAQHLVLILDTSASILCYRIRWRKNKENVSFFFFRARQQSTFCSSQDQVKHILWFSVRYFTNSFPQNGRFIDSQVHELAAAIRSGEFTWEELSIDDADIRLKWAGLFHRRKRFPGTFMMRLKVGGQKCVVFFSRAYHYVVQHVLRSPHDLGAIFLSCWLRVFVFFSLFCLFYHFSAAIILLWPFWIYCRILPIFFIFAAFPFNFGEFLRIWAVKGVVLTGLFFFPIFSEFWWDKKKSETCESRLRKPVQALYQFKTDQKCLRKTKFGFFSENKKTPNLRDWKHPRFSRPVWKIVKF